jgi:hypothetical protein
MLHTISTQVSLQFFGFIIVRVFPRHATYPVRAAAMRIDEFAIILSRNLDVHVCRAKIDSGTK